MKRSLLSLLALFWSCCAVNAQSPGIPGSGGMGIPVGPADAGNIVKNFGGLQFAISQGGIGSPGGSMSGYAVGDNITLQCPGVTFSTSPVIGVGAVSGGAVTGATVANGGVTSNAIPSGSITCTQASTSGSGAGYQVTVTFGVIASYVQPASLTTGGSANNGNFVLNQGPSDAVRALAGAENTFFGTKAGYAFAGNAGFNTAFGHNACGDGAGNSGLAISNNTCLGVDAGRNIAGSTGGTVLIGANAGKNMSSGGRSVIIGFAAASNNNTNSAGSLSGVNHTILGYNAAIGLTSGNGNTCIGQSTCSAITTGSANIILGSSQSGSATDGCANGNESNVFAVCNGNGGRTIVNTGGSTPSTSNTAFAGTTQLATIKTVATLPTCNGAAEGTWAAVSDASGPTYNATVTGGGAVHIPVYCNGTNWTAH